MRKQVLFIQGASEGAYQADAELAKSLQEALGEEYEVVYPAMPNEDDAPYDEWKARIQTELADMQGPVFLAGHSVGGSILLKCLGEIKPKPAIGGICIMATPFWGGDGWRYDGYKQLELPKNLAQKLPQGAPVFIYHCQDDSSVPYEHLALYAKLLPRAKSRTLSKGGHQLQGGLPVVAKDIQATVVA